MVYFENEILELREIEGKGVEVSTVFLRCKRSCFKILIQDRYAKAREPVEGPRQFRIFLSLHFNQSSQKTFDEPLNF